MKRVALAVTVILVVSLVLTACGATPEPEVIEKVVTKEVEVEKIVTQEVEVEKIVTQEVEVEKIVTQEVEVERSSLRRSKSLRCRNPRLSGSGPSS